MARRVRALDPESAELAEVAISCLSLLTLCWLYVEGDPLVARYWVRVRTAVEVQPRADLETSLNAAHGVREVWKRFPFMSQLIEVANKIERRAWQQERWRLGISR